MRRTLRAELLRPRRPVVEVCKFRGFLSMNRAGTSPSKQNEQLLLFLENISQAISELPLPFTNEVANSRGIV